MKMQEQTNTALQLSPTISHGNGEAQSVMPSEFAGMYQAGFDLFKMGYGAAVAYSLFLVVLVVALAQFRLLAFREEIG